MVADLNDEATAMPDSYIVTGAVRGVRRNGANCKDETLEGSHVQNILAWKYLHPITPVGGQILIRELPGRSASPKAPA